MLRHQIGDNVPQYTYSQSAVMPEGRPFRLHCEGCGAVHTLTHAIDDSGRILMAVDREDDELAGTRTSIIDRRPSTVTLRDDGGRQQRNTMFKVFDERDDAAYDERGILRDGHGIRIKLTAMDAAPNGLEGRGTDDDPYIIESGLAPRRRRRARRAQIRDPMGREAGTVLEQSDAMHRPGYRLLGDTDRSLSEAARAQMIHDQANAWRGPQVMSPVETSLSDACPTSTSAQ